LCYGNIQIIRKIEAQILIAWADINMTKTQTIYNLAQCVADELPDMFLKKCPGVGNNFTNLYMYRLNETAVNALGKYYAEQKICEPTVECVDSYVPEESTIIEVELSLYNVHTNLDRDMSAGANLSCR
jgi:hypothetical protein